MPAAGYLTMRKFRVYCMLISASPCRKPQILYNSKMILAHTIDILVHAFIYSYYPPKQANTEQLSTLRLITSAHTLGCCTMSSEWSEQSHAHSS